MSGRPLEPEVVEFEEALLGSCLYDENTFSRVKDLVRPADFYIERHAWIFQAMDELFSEGSPVDYLTVAHRLETNGRIKRLGGFAYLTQLINRSPTSSHAEYYAQQIRLYALLRRVIREAGKLARLAYRREKPEIILPTVQQLLRELLEAISLALFTGESRKEDHG